MSSTIREQRYRICLDFLKTAENKRRWNIFNDIPWDKLDASKATDEVVQRVEIFCAEEMYVPDYSSKGIVLTRASFGPKWFQIRWAYEESNHGSRLSPISIGDRIRGGSRGGQWSKSVNRLKALQTG